MLSPGLLTHLVREARAAARDRDDERTSVAVAVLAAHGDQFDVLAASRAVADHATCALMTMHIPPVASHGEMWVLDDLGTAAGHPAKSFAVRLVTAYANRDQDTVLALVAAACRAGRAHRESSLRELVTYTAALEQLAHKHRERNDG